MISDTLWISNSVPTPWCILSTDIIYSQQSAREVFLAVSLSLISSTSSFKAANKWRESVRVNNKYIRSVDLSHYPSLTPTAARSTSVQGKIRILNSVIVTRLQFIGSRAKGIYCALKLNRPDRLQKKAHGIHMIGCYKSNNCIVLFC